MAVEAGVVYPAPIKTLCHFVAEEPGPGTVVGLQAGSGGAAADGDDAETVGEIGRWIGAPETHGVLVDATLGRHAWGLGIPPNFVVIRANYYAFSLYGLDDRIIN